MSNISELIWDIKYRLYSLDGHYPIEKTIEETLGRVSRFVAENEAHSNYWVKQIERNLEERVLLPAGRILANAGTNRNATLVNTFFTGKIMDDFDDIMKSLKESAKILRMGGGIGCNFSNLRPQGFTISGTSKKEIK